MADASTLCGGSALPRRKRCCKVRPLPLLWMCLFGIAYAQDERLEDYQTAPQHSDWLQCPHGLTALYLATRFHSEHEPFPRMNDPKIGWYVF